MSVLVYFCPFLTFFPRFPVSPTNGSVTLLLLVKYLLGHPLAPAKVYSFAKRTWSPRRRIVPINENHRAGSQPNESSWPDRT